MRPGMPIGRQETSLWLNAVSAPSPVTSRCCISHPAVVIHHPPSALITDHRIVNERCWYVYWFYLLLFGSDDTYRAIRARCIVSAWSQPGSGYIGFKAQRLCQTKRCTRGSWYILVIWNHFLILQTFYNYTLWIGNNVKYALMFTQANQSFFDICLYLHIM